MEITNLLRDLVLCELIEEDDKVGSIIIAGGNPPQKARVLMTGPGRTTKTGHLVPMQVKIGDIVYYEKNTEHNLPGMKDGQVLLTELTILGVEN